MCQLLHTSLKHRCCSFFLFLPLMRETNIGISCSVRGHASLPSPNRFTGGKGWLQGTQVFLQIGPGARAGGTSGGNGHAAVAVASSSGATKHLAAGGEDAAQVVITVSEGGRVGTKARWGG